MTTHPDGDLLKLAEAALEYIDAIPKDIALPAMPGFDRDWANDVLSRHSASASTAGRGEVVRLEARPADDSHDWVEIYPAQLQWMAKEGNQVRAIELAADTSASVVGALRLCKQFIDPDLDPPRMTNRELVAKIDAALTSQGKADAGSGADPFVAAAIEEDTKWPDPILGAAQASQDADRMRRAILGYLSTWDACGGSESVSLERFADARHALREAVAVTSAHRGGEA